MRRTALAAFVAMAAMMVGGCTIRQKIVKIPRTPENLQAFRECQRTVAVAVGYDKAGIERLKYQCLNTLESTSEVVTTDGDDPVAPPGCQQVEYLLGEGSYEYFYLCK